MMASTIIGIAGLLVAASGMWTLGVWLFSR